MSEQLPERCCGRCKHFMSNNHSVDGICAYPFPFWVRRLNLKNCELRHSVNLQKESGTDCPAFEPKETETK